MLPIGTLLLALSLFLTQEQSEAPAPGASTPASGPQDQAHPSAPPAQASSQQEDPPSGTLKGPQPPGKPAEAKRATRFVFSPAQAAQPDPGLAWSPEWYSLDDPDGSAIDPGMHSLAALKRRSYRSLLSERSVLVRDLEPQESLFDALALDEVQMGRFGEFIIEAEDNLEAAGRSWTSMRCSWRTPEGSQPLLACYAVSAAGELRSIWILGPQGSALPALVQDAESLLERFGGPLGARPGAPHYYSQLGAHVLGIDLQEAGFRFEPVDEPRAGERKFIDGVSKANPQFKVAVVQNWIDEASDVSLSYQIIQHDNGLGIPTPFVQWLGGQFQHVQRDSKENGDFPVELIHAPNTLTQVVSPETLAGHYERNKRAPEGGVILGVYLTRSPYARNVQTYWMSSAEETPEYGYGRMIGLRRYVRSRSETILRNSVAIVTLRGKDPAAIERAAGSLGLRSLPLDEDLQLPQ